LVPVLLGLLAGLLDDGGGLAAGVAADLHGLLLGHPQELLRAEAEALLRVGGLVRGTGPHLPQLRGGGVGALGGGLALPALVGQLRLQPGDLLRAGRDEVVDLAPLVPAQRGVKRLLGAVGRRQRRVRGGGTGHVSLTFWLFAGRIARGREQCSDQRPSAAARRAGRATGAGRSPFEATPGPPFDGRAPRWSGTDSSAESSSSARFSARLSARAPGAVGSAWV